MKRIALSRPFKTPVVKDRPPKTADSAAVKREPAGTGANPAGFHRGFHQEFHEGFQKRFRAGPMLLAWAVSLCVLPAAAPLAAQNFGFGDTGAEAEDSGSPMIPTILVGGEAGAVLRGFVNDFSKGADSVRLGDVFSGSLKISAETFFASGLVNLKLRPPLPSAAPVTPVTLDEAYASLYLGDFTLEGGLRKLTWGKADSMGPLDIINPLDYSDLTILVDVLHDNMAQKIARPLVHASLNIGLFSKLEGVFVPQFEPSRFDETGRWAPAHLSDLRGLPPGNVIRPDTTTFDYAQGGLRFTTTIGSVDMGLQYYYGRLPAPALSITPGLPPMVTFGYNPYHQVGIDWAQVIAGFNLRAEAAANLTGDAAGDDGAVYNPSFAWSLGFDYDLGGGLNLNLQAVESITLGHNKIGNNPQLDIEAKSNPTSTRITVKLLKRFFQDRLELTAAALWGIEDRDCLIMPAIAWVQEDITLELAGGFFVGDRAGPFGQYRDNSFIQARMRYTF
jgi:hypothetical protein